MYEVVKQISNNLKLLGHEVTIASGKIPDNSLDNKEKLKIISFDFTRASEAEKYKKFLINSNFDIITNFAAQQPTTDLALPILNKIKSKKIFVPTGFSGLKQKRWKKYFEQMKTFIKKYDLNIFLSNNYQDINFARQNDVPEKKIIVIPNGASEEEFKNPQILNIRKKININTDNFLILHIGSFTGRKGHNEAISIFSQAKINNATLLLIGNGQNNHSNLIKHNSRILNNKKSFRARNKKIIIPEFTRKETVSAYAESDLFLFPSNIECSPIVLFEAMAAGLPFLTSEVGNAKEIITWGNGGILLPIGQETLRKNLFKKISNRTKKYLIKMGLNICFLDIPYSKKDITNSVKILEYIYSSPQKRKELKNNGKKAWQEKFTWEKISKQYEEEYKKLLKI
jgi:glycosyltransferase involved in cell wall biosynthesis